MKTARLKKDRERKRAGYLADGEQFVVGAGGLAGGRHVAPVVAVGLKTMNHPLITGRLPEVARLHAVNRPFGALVAPEGEDRREEEEEQVHPGTGSVVWEDGRKQW